MGKHLGYSAAAISHFLHARRIPSTATVERLYALALDRWHAKGSAETLISIDNLRELAATARIRQPNGRLGQRHGSTTSKGYRRNDSPVGTPAERGYRRNDVRSVPHIAPSAFAGERESVVGSLLTMPPDQRLAALWHLGSLLSVDELAAACAELARNGLRDEVDGLLAGAQDHRSLAGVIKVLLPA
ncbi:hypothetical protein [Kribbella hippodromi]|uniref:hypothetical protein n=1 Tax=Kribbella hippodromi TaxID=434347 RepID=UPI0031D56289